MPSIYLRKFKKRNRRNVKLSKGRYKVRIISNLRSSLTIYEISPGTVLIYLAYQMGIHYGESQDISVTDISQSNRREKMLTLANAPR